MDRRTFLKVTTASLLWEVIMPVNRAMAAEEDGMGLTTLPPEPGASPMASAEDAPVKDYLHKIRNPDNAFADDIYLDQQEQLLLRETLQRLQRLCDNVGDGNFATLAFDEAVNIAKRQVSIGRFSDDELAFMEMIYSRDAGEYGFFGDKQLTSLAQRISTDDFVKVPYSGNYLFKGESLEKYAKIKGTLGDEVVLTSGIRGIIKQFSLFLGKAGRHGGNLSLASRSLAPPGYSYHAVGDFDIGQRGFGAHNFTERFTSTQVYQQLIERGYIDNRYWRDNLLGVRYEPWHIKL